MQKLLNFLMFYTFFGNLKRVMESSAVTFTISHVTVRAAIKGSLDVRLSRGIFSHAETITDPFFLVLISIHCLGLAAAVDTRFVNGTEV